MKNVLAIALLISVAGLVTGCSTIGQTAIPGLAFGALNVDRPDTPQPPVRGPLLAALNGGIMDTKVAAEFNGPERKSALEAEYRALERTPAGEVVAWGESGRRYRGEVVASQPYRVGSQDCRQYKHTVFEGGASVSGQGTACRNQDGSWTPLF